MLASNQRWCSDHLALHARNGEVVRVLFVIDACDREIIAWSAVADAGISGEMVRDLMIAAVERRFGTAKAPHKVEWLSDNGSAYIAKPTAETAAALGLTLLFTPVRSPGSNGGASKLAGHPACALALLVPRLRDYRAGTSALSPISRGRAGPGLLAEVVFGKFGLHLPLHQQGERFGREGVPIDVSTLADWVGAVTRALTPVVLLIEAHVRAGARIHLDDTPVPVLARGKPPNRPALDGGARRSSVRRPGPAGRGLSLFARPLRHPCRGLACWICRHHPGLAATRAEATIAAVSSTHLRSPGKGRPRQESRNGFARPASPITPCRDVGWNRDPLPSIADVPP